MFHRLFGDTKLRSNLLHGKIFMATQLEHFLAFWGKPADVLLYRCVQVIYHNKLFSRIIGDGHGLQLAAEVLLANGFMLKVIDNFILDSRKQVYR